MLDFSKGFWAAERLGSFRVFRRWWLIVLSATGASSGTVSFKSTAIMAGYFLICLFKHFSIHSVIFLGFPEPVLLTGMSLDFSSFAFWTILLTVALSCQSLLPISLYSTPPGFRPYSVLSQKFSAVKSFWLVS
jgi:hypothetical protein